MPKAGSPEQPVRRDRPSLPMRRRTSAGEHKGVPAPPPGLAGARSTDPPAVPSGVSDALRRLLDLSPTEQLQALERLSQEQLPTCPPEEGPPGLAPPATWSVCASDPTWSPDAKACPIPRPLGLDCTAKNPVEAGQARSRAGQREQTERQEQMELVTAQLQAAMLKLAAATKSSQEQQELAKPRSRRTSSTASAPSLPTVSEEDEDPLSDDGVLADAGAVGSGAVRAEDSAEAPAGSVPEGEPQEAIHRILSGLLDAARSKVAANRPEAAPGVQASELVRRCLEEQQAESMQKISRMMQAQSGAIWPAWASNQAAAGVEADSWSTPPDAALDWWPEAAWGVQQPMPWGAQHPPWGAQHNPYAAASHLDVYDTLVDSSWAFEQQQFSHVHALQTDAVESQGWTHVRCHGAHGLGQGSGSKKSAQHDTPGGTSGPSSASMSKHGEVEEDTLRTHLRELQGTDPRKVLVIRKIKALGLEAAAALRGHYSKFGNVEQIYVAHSYGKSTSSNGATRLRPSSPGFLVMARIQDAEAILQQGEQQRVDGAEIQVHRFEHRSLNGANEATLRGG